MVLPDHGRFAVRLGRLAKIRAASRPNCRSGHLGENRRYTTVQMYFTILAQFLTILLILEVLLGSRVLIGSKPAKPSGWWSSFFCWS